MRLLVTITRYWPAIGGAEVHTRQLLQSLGSRVEPVVIAHWADNRTDWLLGTTIRAPAHEDRYDDEGRTVHLIAPSLAERIVTLPVVMGYYAIQGPAAAMLGKVLARHMESVVPAADVVHNVRSGREPLTVGSMQLARKWRVPFVFTPNHHPRWVGWRYRVYHDMYRRADALIALTEHERRELVRLGAHPDRVHVTGIGPVLAESADPQRARERYGLEGRVVLFLGQKYPYKGAKAVLDAAPMVWQRHQDVTFLFVGPRTPYSTSLFQGVNDPRIREVGMVELQDKTDLIASCEVLCVPSSQESFGGVLVEAWTLGKPVIAGPAPAAAEVIDDGKDGFFVREQSPDLIAERLNSLLDNPARASEMGQQGTAKVTARYSWEQLAARTLGIYQALI